MQDLIKRLAVVVIMGICIGLLFIGGRSISAQSLSNQEITENWVWPVLGEITDNFGTRSGRHKGIDIAAPLGENVYSVDEGTVKKSYYSYTYGNVVFISNPGGFETVYAHMNKRSVEEGAIVKRGQKIGEIGSTGRSTGAHLHFEVHVGEWDYEKNNAIDPLAVLNKNNPVTIANQTSKKVKSINKPVRNVEENLVRQEYSEPFDSWNAFAYESGKLLSSSIVVSNQLKSSADQIAGKKIIVKKGDTLWDISQDNLVSIESIRKWNSLEDSLLLVGQELVLYPEKEAVYIVKPGDTIPEIAKEVGSTVEKIIELNFLENEVLYPDQVLIVNEFY